MEESINKEIYREVIEQKIVKMEVDDGIVLTKEDGTTIKFADYHEQECCECVYADWDTAKQYVSEVEGKTIKELVVKAISEMGFLICLYQDWENSIKIFVPCYNSQNGYYSGELELQINGTKLDITEFVEQDIG